MGRTGAEKQEFRDALERMMGMVELEVMLCIEGDIEQYHSQSLSSIILTNNTIIFLWMLRLMEELIIS